MKLEDILDNTAFRGYLNWNYPNLPYKIQLEKHKSKLQSFRSGK